MSEINLLPDDLRGEEEKKIEQMHSKASSPIAFHVPGLNQNKLNSKDISNANIKFKQDLPIPPKPNLDENKESTRFNLDELLSEQKSAPDTVVKKPSREILNKDVISEKKIENKLKPVINGRQVGFWHKLFGNKKKANIISGISNSSVITSDKNFDVNLIPENIDFLTRGQLLIKFSNTALLSFLFVLIISLIVVVFHIGVVNQEKALTEQLDQYKKQVDLLKDKENQVDFWSKKISAIKILLKEHMYITNVFSLLEQYTLPEVFYSSIDLSKDGSISLDASTNGFLGLAKQYKVFQNYPEIFNKIEIGGISVDDKDGTLDFSVNLMINPVNFKKQ